MNKQLCAHCGHQLIRRVSVQGGGRLREKPDQIGEIAKEIYEKQVKGNYNYRHASGDSMCLYPDFCSVLMER